MGCNSDDMALVNRTVTGEKEAFEEIVEKYNNKIFNMAFRMTGSYEDASDIAQDTFVKAYFSLNSFKGESELYTWLYRIARNTALDRFKKTKRRAEVLSIVNDDNSDDIISNISDSTNNPEELYEKQEKYANLHNAIQKLSREDREIIIMRDMNGFTYDQISEITKLNIGTVKSRLNRSRAKLKNILIKGGNFF